MNASTGLGDSGARGTGKRWLLLLPLLATLLAGGWLGLKYSSTGQRAEVGAGYLAHVVCSCRYVGNRDMASCDTDREPGMEMVTVTEDSQRRRITASVPLLASRTARYDPEFGCALDKP
jgi:hypothetical protein